MRVLCARVRTARLCRLAMYLCTLENTQVTSNDKALLLQMATE